MATAPAAAIAPAMRVTATGGTTATAKEREIDGPTLRAASGGDREAFAALVACYDERLRSLALGLLRDRDLMDDALQDVYLRVHRSLGGFRGEARLSTWLYRVTYTTCLGYLRKRSGQLLADCDVADLPAPGAGPLDRFVEDDAIVAALNALTPTQLAVILLVHRDGCSYEEAAQVLDIPSGTVSSRLASAKAALRRRIDALAASEEDS